jgi:hypothetical protein
MILNGTKKTKQIYRYINKSIKTKRDKQINRSIIFTLLLDVTARCRLFVFYYILLFTLRRWEVAMQTLTHMVVK